MKISMVKIYTHFIKIELSLMSNIVSKRSNFLADLKDSPLDPKFFHFLILNSCPLILHVRKENLIIMAS